MRRKSTTLFACAWQASSEEDQFEEPITQALDSNEAAFRQDVDRRCGVEVLERVIVRTCSSGAR